MYVRSMVGSIPLLFLAIGGCSISAQPEATASTSEDLNGDRIRGKLLFELPFPGSNGRACATCHVESDHFALTPAHVSSSRPSDPIFRRIDADDPNAAVPTYNHLREGLVRIVLPLAANLDVIDDAGNVITNAARTIEVWRGVPTIENTSLTAPYQYDGRELTFQSQAAAAFALHSQVHYAVPAQTLGRIAAFEDSVFSSDAVEDTAEVLARGHDAPDPSLTRHFRPGSDEAAGQAIFRQGCALCHGGATGNAVTSQLAHDQTFFAQGPDGTPVFGPQGPVLSGTHQDDPFINIGTAAFSYLTQPGTGPITSGIPPIFQAVTYIDQIPDHSTLPLPHYRLRFYTDASRHTAVLDLPPHVELGLSPSFVPQAYSVDPGRCIISGDPADYESFDVPQLRGLAHTAPYFHDGSMKTLEDVVEFYSSRVFAFVLAAGFPPVLPSLSAGGEPESLTAEQKRQLVAFLRQI